MVSDNLLDQYFQFLKDMLLEEVISELYTRPFCILRKSKLAYHSGFGQSNAAVT